MERQFNYHHNKIVNLVRPEAMFREDGVEVDRYNLLPLPEPVIDFILLRDELENISF